MILSWPHGAIPRMAFEWARQTARALIIVKSHAMTKPSASPVTRREFRKVKVAAWT